MKIFFFLLNIVLLDEYHHPLHFIHIGGVENNPVHNLIQEMKNSNDFQENFEKLRFFEDGSNLKEEEELKIDQFLKDFEHYNCEL